MAGLHSMSKEHNVDTDGLIDYLATDYEYTLIDIGLMAVISPGNEDVRGMPQDITYLVPGTW